jgi:hypothetical protein
MRLAFYGNGDHFLRCMAHRFVRYPTSGLGSSHVRQLPSPRFMRLAFSETLFHHMH